jgi:hypothetical protein
LDRLFCVACVILVVAVFRLASVKWSEIRTTLVVYGLW